MLVSMESRWNDFGFLIWGNDLLRIFFKLSKENPNFSNFEAILGGGEFQLWGLKFFLRLAIEFSKKKSDRQIYQAKIFGSRLCFWSKSSIHVPIYRGFRVPNLVKLRSARIGHFLLVLRKGKKMDENDPNFLSVTSWGVIVVEILDNLINLSQEIANFFIFYCSPSFARRSLHRTDLLEKYEVVIFSQSIVWSNMDSVIDRLVCLC